jgi:uncharacterized protein HemX
VYVCKGFEINGTDKDLQEAAEQEVKREGSAAGLLAGLLILVLLVGSAISIAYFWFQIAATQSNEPIPTTRGEISNEGNNDGR